ncbi:MULTISPECIES: TIGR02391 family protein [unclassified Phyllobacterium]|uniref:TIGR02391 family protein n=1 Tax=unclassified Phyllobacterium TaxID=2638441 RepID=UPI003012B17E
MVSNLADFEGIVRRARLHTEGETAGAANTHPFELRNIHSDLVRLVRKLFDDGHFTHATFDAYKYIDEEIQRISGMTDFGKSLMMTAFNEKGPAVKLNPLVTKSEINEQEGFKYIFAGTALAIRNPRGHSTTIRDDPDTCLDHLSVASLMLRRLDEAGLR